MRAERATAQARGRTNMGSGSRGARSLTQLEHRVLLDGRRLRPVNNSGRIRAYSGDGRAEGDAAVRLCTLVGPPPPVARPAGRTTVVSAGWIRDVRGADSPCAPRGCRVQLSELGEAG